MRKAKIALLVASSGLLLQASGCVSILLQLAAQNLLRDGLTSVLDSILGSSSTTGN